MEFVSMKIMAETKPSDAGPRQATFCLKKQMRVIFAKQYPVSSASDKISTSFCFLSN